MVENGEYEVEKMGGIDSNVFSSLQMNSEIRTRKGTIVFGPMGLRGWKNMAEEKCKIKESSWKRSFF